MSKEDQRIVDTIIKAHNTAMFALRKGLEVEGIVKAALLATIELLPIWNIIPVDFQNGPEVTGKERAYAGIQDAVYCFSDIVNTPYGMSWMNQATSELWAAAMSYADAAIQTANPDTHPDIVREDNKSRHQHLLDSIYMTVS